MFLFAGHSDKPLKSLISIAHKENNICSYRFSFIYVMADLWEGAYTCPIYTVNRTTESANLRYGTHGYGMSAYKGDGGKMQSFSLSCDSPIIKGTSPGI